MGTRRSLGKPCHLAQQEPAWTKHQQAHKRGTIPHGTPSTPPLSLSASTASDPPAAPAHFGSPNFALGTPPTPGSASAPHKARRRGRSRSSRVDFPGIFRGAATQPPCRGGMLTSRSSGGLEERLLLPDLPKKNGGGDRGKGRFKICLWGREISAE